MTYVKKYEINFTVGNGQTMKCEIKGSVNIKIKNGQTVNHNEVLYLPQAVKELLRISSSFQRAPKLGPLRIN